MWYFEFINIFVLTFLTFSEALLMRSWLLTQFKIMKTWVKFRSICSTDYPWHFQQWPLASARPNICVGKGVFDERSAEHASGLYVSNFQNIHDYYGFKLRVQYFGSNGDKIELFIILITCRMSIVYDHILVCGVQCHTTPSLCVYRYTSPCVTLWKHDKKLASSKWNIYTQFSERRRK